MVRAKQTRVPNLPKTISMTQRNKYAFPFIQKGWDLEEDISARTSTKDMWYISVC